MALPQAYPTMSQFADFMSKQYGTIEVVAQPLYDYILYPTAGSAAPFQFFQNPIGQALSSSSGNVANPKGLADTNLQLAGQLPSPQAFWCTGIEVDIQAGSSAGANAFVLIAPAIFAAAAATTVQAGAHDVNAIASGGVLQFRISNKDYYTEGPLYRFPPTRGKSLQVSVASNSATVGEVAKELMSVVGEPVSLDPGFAIGAGQSFGVTITYPTAIATAANNARVGVILRGYVFRPVQ